MKKYITISLLIYFSLSFSQTSSLRGRVIDTNGFPLPGATVQTQPSSKAVFTDFNGFFTILDIEGEQTIKISYLGFETFEEKINITSGKTTNETFILSPAIDELNEVVLSVFQDGIIKGLISKNLI